MKYKGIPIAIMTNFYQQINDELRSEMEREDFKTKLNYSSIEEQEQIQVFFDKILAPLKKPLMAQLDGKIVINLDYTRIPMNTLIDHFNSGNTMILSRSKSSEYYGIPNLCLSSFKNDTTEISNQLIKRANSILAKYEVHPAFSNTYFSQTFMKRIPIIVDAIETVVNFYDKNQVAAVLIGTTEDIISRSLAVIGEMKGIPSICLQHGILMGEEAFLPVFSSHVGIYGEYEKRWYMTRGLGEDRISVIGHPRYDEIFTSIRMTKNMFMKEYHLDPHKITLLIATGPSLDPIKIKTLITQLASNPAYQLIIKPHPWELSKKRISLYTELERKYDSIHVITDKKVNTHDLIFNSDGVIASLSTVVLESFLFNKPVFVYYFIQSNREYDYYNTLDQYIQKEPSELVNMISLYFTSEIEKSGFKDVKNKFLENSYKTMNAGKELEDFIYQLTKVRP